MSVYALTGVVRPYAWGSRTLIAELQGRSGPTEQPEAELWLGAHPGDPATVAGPDGPVSLEALIADDPKGQLGGPVLESFGPRLPYLLKVLAAETPLSLQAHPDPEYAKLAYARQEADPGLPRNYTDPHHKPEMLVALTPFEALCGFRPPADAADEIASFGLESLAPVVEALRGGDLRTAVQTLLTWPEDNRGELIAAVAESGRSELATHLAGHYPGDPGVLVALLLNHVRLAPGEAIWMPAGNMHAYLKGLGVELMAASDNVLRGGLTPKRVDVGELLNVLRFEVLEDPILPSTEVAPGVTTWKVPVPDFELFRIELDGTRAPAEVPAGGPRIVLGVSGDTYVGEAVDGTPVALTAGTAAYAPADAGRIKVAGQGQLFVAAVPA
ncbi:putative mannose-6-phosphate isomerase ManA [Paractinoplanes abujensis]|uniref:mannose-6-phosphate isomerase n=1 Tax=Paractinoplanes abujensis TaxID=882441 RepID=A0A7W7CY39_9ACTN|nr:mannose-6-phosphate isomerase, class I [Actinoplanes abujensis]MBB4695121.1 mannose-6-phosphate isomerase [Actinoplanes abujensis]GID23853.1 putative mannose-6-phosphate isomerase ManA [Actinoplanes abujensis]